jgi:hypothetical protein
MPSQENKAGAKPLILNGFLAPRVSFSIASGN